MKNDYIVTDTNEIDPSLVPDVHLPPTRKNCQRLDGSRKTQQSLSNRTSNRRNKQSAKRKMLKKMRRENKC